MMRWFVRGRDPRMTLVLVHMSGRGPRRSMSVLRAEDFRGGLVAARTEVKRRNDLRREAEAADKGGRTPPPMMRGQHITLAVVDEIHQMPEEAPK